MTSPVEICQAEYDDGEDQWFCQVDKGHPDRHCHTAVEWEIRWWGGNEEEAVWIYRPKRSRR